MKILVTGGLGFIGSNFIRYVLSKYDDVNVVNLDSFSYGSNPMNLKDVEKDSRYELIKGNTSDRNLVTKIVSNIHAIVNLAAETHVDRSVRNPHLFFRNNTRGTFELLDAARKSGVDVFLNVSTDETYGVAQPTTSFKESDRLHPSNPYSASKAAAEMFALAYNKTYGLKTILTRCTNNFGPYQFPEKFIPKSIIRASLGLKIPVYGSGKQIRDWIYVTDHCEALDLAMRKGRPGEIYNICSGNELQNAEIAKLITQILGKDGDPIEFVEDRPGHDLRYSLDSTKIKTELGWTPKSNFEEALRNTVHWYTSNEQWWKPIISKQILHPTPWKFEW